MDFKMLEELKEHLMEELKPLSKKTTHTLAEVDAIDKMTHTIKSICAIMEKEGGQSGAGRWEAQGMSYGPYNSYDGGYSGRHYVRGHYSRDGEMSNNSYSYDDGRAYMRDRMQANMDGMYNDMRDDMMSRGRF